MDDAMGRPLRVWDVNRYAGSEIVTETVQAHYIAQKDEHFSFYKDNVLVFSVRNTEVSTIRGGEVIEVTE